MIIVKENRASENGHKITTYTVEVEAFEIEKVNLSEVPINKFDLVTRRGSASDRFTDGANLLDKVEKSDDKGGKVLAVSENLTFQYTEEDGIRFRASQTEFDEIAEEEAKIIAEAKENGTYLKAPNGKASKLSPEQWVQVRTSRFKEWFGDWELAYKKNYLLNGKAVSTLAGNEFSKVEGKTLTYQVEEFFNSIGNKAISPIYGEVILDRKGADDSLAHGMGRKKAVAYAAVKDVIENGIVIGYDSNHKNRGYDSVIIAAPININKEEHICEVVITRMDDNRFYLHEVTPIKKLQGAVFLTNSGQSPSAHLGVAAKILQNVVSASDDVSKIIDENGEPMVVYHGTDEEFYEFKLYVYAGVTNRYDERPSDHFLFTPNVIAASDYGETMPLYIKAEKLLRVDDKYDVSDIISKKAIGKYLDKTALSKSDIQSIHLSALKRLPDIISESIFVEIHPDYKKGDDERSVNNGVGSSDLLVHRMYGAITIEENTYRVKTTLHEFKNKSIATTPHSYEVTEIEPLEGTLETTHAQSADFVSSASNSSITGANLLNGVENSNGLPILNSSKIIDENGDRNIAMIHRLGSLMYDELSDSYVPIKITVKEFTNEENKRIYSVEAIDIETQKKSAGQLVSDSKEKGATPITDFSVKIQELIESAKNSSKIVDENEEPMVVYHGTYEEFYEFKLYVDTGVINCYDERPSNHFLFTPNVIAASDYCKTMPLYIKAEKLLRVDDKYNVSDIISKKAKGKYLDKTALSKSDNQSIHISALKRLPDIISESIFVEIHTESKKGDDELRSVNNGVGSSDLLVHRMYGAITIEENTYRVNTTLHEFENKSISTTPHSYEVTEIESLDGHWTTHTQSADFVPTSNNSIVTTNLLNGVENSNGLPILNSSKIVDENGEPMVVYHQTNRTIYRNAETDENWDELDWREKQEWEERDDWEEYWQEEDFYEFSRVNARTTNEFDGFFFAPKYDEYHEYGNRTISAFLNIRKPASREDYNIDAQYNNAGQKERIRLQNEG